MVRLIRTGAAWVIALLVLSLTTVEMPHMGGAHHDLDLDIIVVAHDASAHHVSDGQIQSARSEHCLACHWGRSFRPGAEPSNLSAPLTETTVARISQQPFIPGRAPIAQPSLRSPPA